MQKEGSYRVFSIRVRSELVRRVDEVAAAKRLSRNQLIVDWMEVGVGQDELTVKVMANPTLLKAITGAMAEPSVLRALGRVVGKELDDQQLLEFGKVMGQMESGAERVLSQGKGKGKSK